MSSVSSFWNLVWSSQLQNGLFVGLFDFFIVWWGGDRTILSTSIVLVESDITFSRVPNQRPQQDCSWPGLLAGRGLSRGVGQETRRVAGDHQDSHRKQRNCRRKLDFTGISLKGDILFLKVKCIRDIKRWSYENFRSERVVRVRFCFCLLWHFFAKNWISTQSWACVLLDRVVHKLLILSLRWIPFARRNNFTSLVCGDGDSGGHEGQCRVLQDGRPCLQSARRSQQQQLCQCGAYFGHRQKVMKWKTYFWYMDSNDIEIL